MPNEKPKDEPKDVVGDVVLDSPVPTEIKEQTVPAPSSPPVRPEPFKGSHFMKPEDAAKWKAQAASVIEAEGGTVV